MTVFRQSLPFQRVLFARQAKVERYIAYLYFMAIIHTLRHSYSLTYLYIPSPY